MTIEMNNQQITLLLALVFILMTSSLLALKFILGADIELFKNLDKNKAGTILDRLIKISLFIALSLFIVSFTIFKST